jgi:hypothetical protein
MKSAYYWKAAERLFRPAISRDPVPPWVRISESVELRTCFMWARNFASDIRLPRWNTESVFSNYTSRMPVSWVLLLPTMNGTLMLPSLSSCAYCSRCERVAGISVHPEHLGKCVTTSADNPTVMSSPSDRRKQFRTCCLAPQMEY